MMRTFQNQSILVVGGSSGIGLAAAKAFSDAGGDVTIASRSHDKLAEALRHLPGVTTSSLDITRDEDVDKFFDAAPVFDHVVVSAAQTPGGPSRSLKLADAYAAMNSKFWGAYRVARRVRIHAGGSLTLVSGFLSVRPSATSVLQGAINAALEALARGLALELSPIRVNTVSPGIVATPLWSGMSDEARNQMFESAANRLPAKRVGSAEDIANAILYLAGTPYATGSTVLVDGGGAIA
ncbi:SDR family oxidoreductase [Dyella koreensis]|uniref:SDR family oxidoreductase n=1 Tax=Dyella koreensis TaxID=311235 RepID=A0ABW8K9V3_9GAMM